jgi:hypothetical protein
MPAVRLVDLRLAFPATPPEREAFAKEHLPELRQGWLYNGFPVPEVLHVLVHRPGQFASETRPEQATHFGDESGAWEEETGRVAVGAATVTDAVEGAEAFEVLRVRTS